MNFVRIAISALLVAVTVLSVLGWSWADASPPAAATGSRVAFAIIIATSLLGLFRLWRPQVRNSH